MPTDPRHVIYSEVASGSEGWLIERLRRETGRTLLCITTSDREMAMLAQQLRYFAPDTAVLAFPAWDCLPYDRVSPKQQIMAERLAVLSTLVESANEKNRIIVTTANAVTQKLPPQSLIAASTLKLQAGGALDRDALMRYLTANGYQRVSKVMEAGEFALRGNIIDLFPSGFEQGCRIDLFGDDIEKIHLFDPFSQRSSTETIDGITLHPVSEILLNESSIEHFRNRYRQLFGAVSKPDPLYESVSSGHHYPGMEHWLPLFYEKTETLFDYLPEQTLTLLTHQSDHAIQDRSELVQDYYQARQAMPSADIAYHAIAPDLLYLSGDHWTNLIASQDTIHLTPFTESDDKTQPVISQKIRRGRDFAPDRKQGRNPFEAVAEHIQTLQGSGVAVTVACQSEGSRQRIQEKLAQYFHSPLEGESKSAKRDWVGGKKESITNNTPHDSAANASVLASSAPLQGGSVRFATFPLPHGFVTPELAVISEQDILGERLSQPTRKRRRTELFMAEAANFSEGELIVHREHGIGRFEGLVTMEVQGIAHDCLKLVYAEDAKLFLPVENIDMISRYGSSDEEGETPLDRLGGTHWQSRKAKMKERIRLAAEELLKIAARRELAQAPMLAPAEGLYEEFCNRFPYMETEDQEKAIADVIDDLASGHPADRLICGDVGFGKTEVALRAAFVAATAGENAVQVAIITPTTLLARQHYQTFRKRFEGFPVNIRVLSRLVGSKETSTTLADLESGKVDIIIGTHALLSERVKFKKLGVLVVDEEQHFGVKQKEQLKKLRSNIHVFTLSATPIPRTMQLALAGVRELSLITTPPIDRLAVRTFVTPFDPVVIREALLREYHRGGQSFYVTPYIKDIAELKVKLQEMAPELKIAVANGQMAAGALDKIMNAFYDGQYDILLSTAIIESGIDIPNANTLIINRADRFGLSQLYQLRGRVGRSKVRAYAYLTLPHGRNFTANAMKRLEVMQTLDTLGAGFSVASHDMDIRGFGNLLGEEQSGHIREVGVELYQHMLEEAVTNARKAKSGDTVAAAEPEWQPQIKLGLSVLIPETYVPDLDLRLGLYRRAGGLRSEEEIEQFAVELIDRFGPLPEEIRHFLTTLKLKLVCLAAGIERLDVGPKGMVITFYQNKVARPEGLVDFLANPRYKAKLRSDQKLVLPFDIAVQEQRLEHVRKLLVELQGKLSPATPQAA